MKTKWKLHHFAIVACVCIIFAFSTIGNAAPIIKEDSGLKVIGPPPLPPTTGNLSPNTNGFGQPVTRSRIIPLDSSYNLPLQAGWNYISVPYWLTPGFDTGGPYLAM
jgi:hypothetical protein